MFGSSLPLTICFVVVSGLVTCVWFKKIIYVCWYEARFSYQMRFVLFKSNMTGVISKICSSNSLEAPDTSLVFSGF